MMTKTPIAICIAAMIGLNGCASTDQGQTRAEGASAGALIGGAIGLLLGDSKEAAALGAIVGAVAGDLFAKRVIRKKAEYANTEDYMNAVIKDAESTLVQSQKERSTLLANFNKYQSEIAQLKKQQNSQSSLNAALNEQSSQASEDLKTANALIESVEKEIALQTKILEEERQVIPVALVTHSESTISALESEKRQLQLLHSQIATLDRRKLL